MTYCKSKLEIKAVLMTVFFITASFSQTLAKPRIKDPSVPDFAYPQKVESDSRLNLNKALQKKSEVEILREFMNLTIASTQISTEKAPALLKELDSISNILRPPYRAVAYLLEAEIYSDIYSRYRGRYDGRTVNAGMDADNPEFWDRKMFASKIDSLTSLALKEKSQASEMPLKDFSLIICSSGDLDSFTLYDFIAYKSIELNSDVGYEKTIPFFASASTIFDPEKIIDSLLTLHEDPSQARNTAIIEKIRFLQPQEAKQFLWHEIVNYKNSEYVIPLITRYFDNYVSSSSSIGSSEINNTPNYQDFFKYLNDLKKEITGIKNLRQIDGLLCRMTSQNVSLNFKSSYTTQIETDVDVCSTNNKDFYVLLLRLGDEETRNFKTKEISTKTKRIDFQRVEINKQVPFQDTLKLKFKISEPGLYTFIASETPNADGIIHRGETFYPTTFRVSDIDIISVNHVNYNNDSKDILKEQQPDCFVVLSSDGSPVEGADVVFEKQNYYYYSQNAKKETEKVRTDKDGSASTNFKDARVKASFNGSVAISGVNEYSEPLAKKSVHSRIFTDRQVYRPGDTVKIMGLIFSTNNYEGSLDKDFELRLTLRNANYETVDSLTLKTDEGGRYFGEFTIPKEGLLGNWTLSDEYNTRFIQIAEYKTPSFFVNLEKDGADVDSIKFNGTVATYSGLPVANCNVDYTITFTPGYYFPNRHDSESFHSSVQADSSGNFTIALPIKNLDLNQYRGLFAIEASATDEAGESVDSSWIPFWLVSEYGIIPSIPSSVLVGEDEKVKMLVKVVDCSRMPVNKMVTYRITGINDAVSLEGEFESPQWEFNTSSLPSGKYKITLNIVGEDAPAYTDEVILYRVTDGAPPVTTCLWVPQKELTVAPDQKSVSIEFGCSYEGQYVLCFISDSKGNESYEWIVSTGKNMKIDIPAPSFDERKYVDLLSFRDHVFYSETITIIPEIQTEKLQIATETFRSSIEPGTPEEWKFRLKFNGQPSKGYAYALLYDEALDAIAPLYWNTVLFNPYYPYGLRTHGDSSHNLTDIFNVGNCKTDYFPQTSLKFQTYGYPLVYVMHRFGAEYKLMARSTSYNSDSAQITGSFRAIEDADAEMGMAEESIEVYNRSSMKSSAVNTQDVGDDLGKEPDLPQLRPIEMPVALWKPDIETPDNGEITIDFTVPDFNTTWKFIMGAYTDGLTSSEITLETVASKKVMAKMLVPRFIRTGDRAVLTATIFNNSDILASITGEFEIFDPATGEILLRKSENLEIDAFLSSTISLDYDCGNNMNFLGLRVYARAEGSSDGEQTVIPILPSSQPIIESQTFYISPDTKDVTLKLSPVNADATTTFQYCDNPLWEAVTALPSIVTPESESLTSQIAALYANCVGYGLFNNYPSLRDGLRLILEGEGASELLQSKLQQNEQLKTVTLNNTPWVNDASSETLRLRSLGSLLDEKSALDAIKTVWTRIGNLRNPDGGWSWCSGMKSSRWITEAFLINMGLLRQGNYLPALENEDTYLRDALKFVDGEYVNEYYKIKGDKSGFYRSLFPYLYTRAMFHDYEPSFSMRNISKEALKYLNANWKHLSIFEKATAALTLWRNGYTQGALEILESLRQYSSSDKEKGVWFDNLDSEIHGPGKLLTTARVLVAFNVIQPKDPMVDGLRQWMLIQKQSQDWQEGLWCIDAIEALLTSGSEWDAEYSTPVIKINGVEIGSDEISKLTGAVTVNLDLKGQSIPEIEISRTSPTPAWGGVISQFITPVIEVKSASIPDLSISKEVWKIVETPEGKMAVKTDSLEVGDKVRISLIVDCGKDMDFVALTDERSGCLEPSDQLSSYSVIDGVWCYRETRNSATNIFFDLLPRGRHVFTYECRVMLEGAFSCGVATMQSLYSPLITAHSAGAILNVTK